MKQTDKIIGQELSDKELEGIGGGASATGSPKKISAKCENCKVVRTFYVYSGAQGVCSKCNHTQMV